MRYYRLTVIICCWQKFKMLFKSKLDTKADSIEDGSKQVEKPANPLVVFVQLSPSLCKETMVR